MKFLAQTFNSVVIDIAVKIMVPIILGICGYGFSWAIDINSRLIALESTQFTREDAKKLESVINVHETSIQLIKDRQSSALDIQNRLCTTQETILMNQAQTKATLYEMSKQLDRLLAGK